MNHLDEGTLMALRDSSPVDHLAGAQAHLAECPQCSAALKELHRTEDAVSAALSTLDEPFELEEARMVVRARVAEHTARAAGTRSIPARPRRAVLALGRAAGLVLLAAVGAYAIPGSPVRSWLHDAVAPSETVGVDAEEAVATSGSPESAGIRVTVEAPVVVRLLGLAPGAEVGVAWVPGAEVSVFASPDSRFNSSTSLVQATVGSGPVRVELPMGVHPVTLEVGGRVWLRSLEDGPETEVEPTEAGPRFMRFVVPGGDGA